MTMSTPNADEASSAKERCTYCGYRNPGAQKFCGECGTSLAKEASLLSDETVRAHIRKLIKEELADEKVVEVEITEKVLDRINRWAKLLGYFAGIPLAALILVLSFLGVKKYSDLWELTNAAEQKVRPLVESAQEQARVVDDKTKVLRSQTDAVDQRTKQLMSQTNNFQQRLNSLQPKLAGIEAGSKKLEELSVQVKETLSKQAALEGQVNEIRKAIANPANFMAGRNGFSPEAIVIHVINGTFKAAETTFADGDVRTSAHYGISKTGEVVQYVDEKDTAFHVGIVVGPTWSLLKPNVNPNFYTIGITHEGKFEEAWTPEMYTASAKLIAQIAKRWGIPIDRQHVIGHHEIRASKVCPGTGVDLDRLVQMAKQRP